MPWIKSVKEILNDLGAERTQFTGVYDTMYFKLNTE